MKHLNVPLDDALHRRFKLACVHEGKEMAEVVRKLVAEYVEKVEKKSQKR